MKKILPVLISISLLTVLVFPLIISAQPPAPVESCKMKHTVTGTGFNCPPVNSQCRYDSPTYTCASCCLVDKIYTITDWFFAIAIGLAIIFALWGGFLLMTAAGEPEKVTKGRQWIMWAGVGVVVALLAKAIPGLVRAIVA